MSVLKHGGGFILLSVSYDSCLTDVSPGLYTFGFWLECMLYVYLQLGRERGKSDFDEEFNYICVSYR